MTENVSISSVRLTLCQGRSFKIDLIFFFYIIVQEEWVFIIRGLFPRENDFWIQSTKCSSH
jgi:hypothetical protein